MRDGAVLRLLELSAGLLGLGTKRTSLLAHPFPLLLFHVGGFWRDLCVFSQCVAQTLVRFSVLDFRMLRVDVFRCENSSHDLLHVFGWKKTLCLLTG